MTSDIMTITSDIMTIQEACEYLKLNEKTAYRLAAEGKILSFKVGGSWRFKRSDIESRINSSAAKRIDRNDKA